jgi:radical SAM protein with 4Fe4S-binding SPASM domain
MKKKDNVSIIDKCAECLKIDSDFPLVAEIPNNIMIEVTNACNLSCKMCYHKDMKRKIGFMTENLFRKVIDQAVELGISNVGLYTVGESFLHPNIFDFIKIAKEKGVPYVYITTNGLALEGDRIERIFESGLDSIKFSIDAASAETYEDMKVGGKWSQLIENIKRLRKMRDRKKSKLRIFGSFIVTKENYSDLLKYNAFFGDLVDETLASFIVNQGSQVDSDSLTPKVVAEKMDKLILPREKWHPCSLLWNRFVVNYDGKLTICCQDFDAKLVYGDLNNNTLKECWNNNKIQNLRKTHREGGFSTMPLCCDCYMVKHDQKAEKDLNTHFLHMTNM